jgi:hypothetical protein
VKQIFPDSIRSSFVPVGTRIHSLLRRKQFNESAIEMIEYVGLADVLVQADRQELRQDEDLVDARMDAIADRNIDQSVFGCERYRRLGADFRERIEPCSSPAP